jgi:hypothetical protein
MRAKGPEWLMSNNDKEKSLSVYLTIETSGYEKKPPRAANYNDGKMA